MGLGYNLCREEKRRMSYKYPFRMYNILMQIHWHRVQIIQLNVSRMTRTNFDHYTQIHVRTSSKWGEIASSANLSRVSSSSYSLGTISCLMNLPSYVRLKSRGPAPNISVSSLHFRSRGNYENRINWYTDDATAEAEKNRWEIQFDYSKQLFPHTFMLVYIRSP